MMTMKSRTNLVLVVGISLGILLCASLCFGQETAIERHARVYGGNRLSPATKLQLYSHDPSVCHCDECRRMRLAAGVEYMGMTPLRRPRPRVPVVPPLVYTPAKPKPVLGAGGFYMYCRSTNSIITRDSCPDKK